VIIVGLSAEPWLKDALFAGWKLASVRPSNPTPNSIVGFEHVPKFGVVARATEPGPPPGAAGMFVKSVWIPSPLLNASAPAPVPAGAAAAAAWAFVHASRVACGALHLLARISQIARVIMLRFSAEA